MLQEDVQKCITDFKDAGIRVWMLTGDSGRTAREIGIQCGIIRPTQKEENNTFLMEDELATNEIIGQVKDIIQRSKSLESC